MNRKERRAARKTGQAGGLSQSFSSQLRDIGDRHAQAGDVAQAESLYRQALAGDPDDIITLHRLGHLATRTGRIDEAFTLLSRAIGINRHVPELHMVWPRLAMPPDGLRTRPCIVPRPLACARTTRKRTSSRAMC